MSGLGNRSSRITALSAAALLLPIFAGFAQVQEPATPTASSSQEQSPAASPDKTKKQKYSHANDFLILGTVFDEKGLSFPAVQLRIRRSREKKFRWDTYTNSRGEFAIRVPKGADYEMMVHAKGFADQTRPLDAKTGLSEARLVFRMEPAGGEKK
jgi:hypothetical protein